MVAQAGDQQLINRLELTKKLLKKSVLKVQNLEVKTEQMTFMNQSGQKRLRLMTTHNLIDDRSQCLKIT